MKSRIQTRPQSLFVISVGIIFTGLIALAGCGGNGTTRIATPPPASSIATATIDSGSTPITPATPTYSTPTVVFTETPLPVTDTPTQSLNNQLLGRNMIAIMEHGGAKIYLFDLDTGYTRMLDLSPEYRPLRVLAWSDNGCEMVIEAHGYPQNPDTVLLVDLQGNILRNMLPIEQDIHMRNIFISPSQEWIAYRLSEGGAREIGSDYDPIMEFENIEVISVGGEAGPYGITQGDGGIEAAWSPDSTRLAFGDYDANEVPQLYVYDLDSSERMQLTRFEEPLVQINNIQWSPDGEWIAFAYYRYGNASDFLPNKTDVIILPSETGSPTPVLVEQVYLANYLWWQDNDTLVVWGHRSGYDFINSRSERLFWVDADTGQIADILVHTMAPGGYIGIPHPLGSSARIGFFTGHKFYSYDTTSHSFQIWNNADLENSLPGNFIMRGWISAPGSFPGEAACQP